MQEALRLARSGKPTAFFNALSQDGRRIESYYEVDYECLLGAGAFSQVYVARRLSDGQEFAVKVMDKQTMSDRGSAVRQEIDLVLGMKHALVVNCYDAFEDDRNVYLVMDLLEGGDLYQRLCSQYPRGMAETLAAKIIKRLVTVVAFLHSQGIIHRDLKPENLLYVDDYDDQNIRLTDFGLARVFNDDVVIRTQAGSPTYVAPEILTLRGYSKAVDLWSIGVITFVLLTCYPPFQDTSALRLNEKIIAGNYTMPDEQWANISERCKDFIRRLLVVDPEARMNANEALQHPWIVDVAPHVAPGEEHIPISEDALYE